MQVKCFQNDNGTNCSAVITPKLTAEKLAPCRAAAPSTMAFQTRKSSPQHIALYEDHLAFEATTFANRKRNGTLKITLMATSMTCVNFEVEVMQIGYANVPPGYLKESIYIIEFHNQIQTLLFHFFSLLDDAQTQHRCCGSSCPNSSSKQ